MPGTALSWALLPPPAADRRGRRGRVTPLKAGLARLAIPYTLQMLPFLPAKEGDAGGEGST